MDDLIVEKEVGEDLDQHQNVGKARFMGAEFALATLFFKNHDIALHYTYLNAEDRSDDRTSDHLEEQSAHKIYASDLFTVTDWLALYGKVSYNSKRYYEDGDNWETLDGFWLVDAKAIFTGVDHLSVEGGCEEPF